MHLCVCICWNNKTPHTILLATLATWLCTGQWVGQPPTETSQTKTVSLQWHFVQTNVAQMIWLWWFTDDSQCNFNIHIFSLSEMSLSFERVFVKLDSDNHGWIIMTWSSRHFLSCPLITAEFKIVHYFGLWPNTCKTNNRLISVSSTLCLVLTEKYEYITALTEIGEHG